MKPVIFWGATGQAKVLREALSGSDTILVALFDNRQISSPFDDVPIFYSEAGLSSWKETHYSDHLVHACVAIGGQHGKERFDRLHWLLEHGHPPLSVYHSRAFIADSAVLGRGCQVLALAAVCTDTRLGEAVIVNTKASIDHDCIIGNGVHIGPGATLAGEVIVDDFSFVGAGAVILPRLRVGTNAIVGAGAVVTRDVPSGTTVIGNPARPYHQNI
jgi:sugar O-acyltransferase (sialic acid O-acetyltransferase NeuD family)